MKNNNYQKEMIISKQKQFNFNKFLINTNSNIWENDNKNSLIFEEFELLSSSFTESLENNNNDIKLNLITFYIKFLIKAIYNQKINI